MEGHNTTVVSNTEYGKNNPGFDYPQQPAPNTYYHDNSGQPPYYQPNPATPGYYPAQSSHMSNNTVVVTQPAPYTTHVVPVQDNMGLAIFACLCCCWPLGLVAIFRANESRDAVARGDIASAQRNAADARKFSLIAIGCGIVIILIAIIVPIVIVTTAAASTYSNYNSRTYYNG